MIDVWQVAGTAAVSVEPGIIDLYRQMHESVDNFRGLSLRQHLNDITRLVLNHDTRTILDYGCGKADLYTALNLRERWRARVYLYDPAVRQFATKPQGLFDGVICTDVLEHIPEEDVPRTLREILGFADQWAFLSICTRPARKTFPDGRNVHLTVRPQEWWEARLAEARPKNSRTLVEVAYTT